MGRGAEQDGAGHADHDQALPHQIGRGDGEHRPALAAGHPFEIILEGEERHDEDRDEDRAAIGAVEQIVPDLGEGETGEGETQAARRAGERPAQQEAAHRVEMAAGPLDGQETAGALGKPQGRGVAEDRDPDPDGGEDAVFRAAHHPGHQHLREIGAAGGGDAQAEHADRRPTDARSGRQQPGACPLGERRGAPEGAGRQLVRRHGCTLPRRRMREGRRVPVQLNQGGVSTRLSRG